VPPIACANVAFAADQLDADPQSLAVGVILRPALSETSCLALRHVARASPFADAAVQVQTPTRPPLWSKPCGRAVAQSSVHPLLEQVLLDEVVARRVLYPSAKRGRSFASPCNRRSPTAKFAASLRGVLQDEVRHLPATSNGTTQKRRRIAWSTTLSSVRGCRRKAAKVG
jgi:hypothetical protein